MLKGENRSSLLGERGRKGLLIGRFDLRRGGEICLVKRGKGERKLHPKGKEKSSTLS